MEDNSVLNEDSNLEDVAGKFIDFSLFFNKIIDFSAASAPRKSMSQPSLAGLGEPKKGLSNAFSASNVRSIPIIQTWHENEEMKGQIYTLRCEVQMHERKYLEAKGLCHRNVQDVMDEYVEMKIAQDDWEQKMRQFKQMEMDIDECSRQKTEMEQRIRELEISLTEQQEQRATVTSDVNNTTCGSLRGTLDDIMKRNDPDFTLTSGYDEKIAELEGKLMSEMDKVAELEDQVKNLLEEVKDQSARLAQSENARAQLEEAASHGVSVMVPNSTFVIGNARQSQTEQQIKYIDELETKLTDAKSESEKARLALVEYMNKCSKLENEMHRIKKNQTFDTSSLLIGQTSEELKAQITKVNGELNSLRAENRELRIRCHQLNGETDDGNLSSSLLGHSRLMAGISSTDLADSNETGGTSMRIVPSSGGASHLEAELEESKLPLMDTSAAVRSKQAFDAAYDDFESLKDGLLNNDNNTLESSFNSSMPPPDRDATQSFLSQKSFKNSPLAAPQRPKPLQQLMTSSGADQIQNHSFSTKATPSPHPSHLPILQDVQQILDSSAILLEGQHEAAANVEKMQAKMSQIRDALSRLFERLKSSAALFEDILEKSIVAESFIAGVSRRFTIAPDAEDVASSSLLNASYSPIFKFSNNVMEVEKLQNEVAELRNELEKARVRGDMKSPLQNSSGRLSDVQLKAAQNFEDLEVCQATLNKVEAEKAELMNELSRLEDSHRRLVAELDEAKRQMENTLVRCAAEQDARLNAEEILEDTKRSVEVLKREQTNAMMIEVDYRVTEAKELVEREKKAIIESLSSELQTALAEENAVRDHLERMEHEMELLRRRAREAEDRVERTANEKHEMVEHIVSLEEKMEKAAAFEKESADYAGKLAARKKEIEVSKKREDMVNAAIEGLERVRKEVVELTKKTLKTQIILGNASSIRLVCDELCRRLTRERELQHESAETMKYVNDNIEQLQKENLEMQSKIRESLGVSKKSSPSISNNKENAPPPVASSEAPVTAPPSSSQKTSTTASNFVSPTRQLLHESTMAVDSIVQKLKKTYTMSGMGAELKETIGNLIIESRGLRDFLHQKLILFKGIDMTMWKNDSVDQLVEKLAQYLQDNLILEEQIKKYKKELKLTKDVIPNLGADVQERIKREIGGIASDMGAVKALRNKK
ncbi:hypothetical protein CRE_16385 [Caenorhabditis remanei]|uniref:Uncharacterized protein n=2 Tax=Caenorhabditis remanei TaxID=31234 RepID=E3NC50_CAERE|nr:hypothetical protein CRE_16385 [Caenorhabditis remanei]